MAVSAKQRRRGSGVSLPILNARIASLPAEIDGHAIASALRAALDGATDATGKQNELGAETLAAAVEVLLGAGQAREALSLLNLVDASHSIPKLMIARSKALLAAGDIPGFLREAEAQVGRPDLNDRVRGFLIKRLRFDKSLVSEPRVLRLHEFVWGEPDPSLRQTLRSLRDDSEPGGQFDSRFLANLLGVRDDAPDPAEFAKRLRWGFLVNEYCEFVLRCGPSPPSPSPGEPREVSLARALAKGIEGLVSLRDDGGLRREAASGRSVLICGAHTGMWGYYRPLLSLAGLPSAAVARSNKPSSGSYLHVCASASDAAQQFLRLLKAVRTSQRAVMIHADGPFGDQVERSLFGRPVRIGLGAATLAHHGRMATFFPQTRWNGATFDLDLIPGPVADGSLSREAFSDRLHDFYIERLEAILLGPPEDIVPRGNYLSSFM